MLFRALFFFSPKRLKYKRVAKNIGIHTLVQTAISLPVFFLYGSSAGMEKVDYASCFPGAKPTLNRYCCSNFLISELIDLFPDREEAVRIALLLQTV